MTERVDYLGAFLKKVQKIENEVTVTEKHNFEVLKKVHKFYFFVSSDLNLNFFAIISTMRQSLSSLPVILSYFL